MNERAPSADQEKSGERIAKLLARAGIASRREVERMIAEGRVRIGDDVVETPATLLTDLRGVTVDGKPVGRPAAARLFRFHKPAGLITAERDPAGRPTIYTALRNALPPGTPRMMPVGRLDFNTEGMLLLTNDGELKRALELPSSGIPRTYRARAFGAVTQDQLEALIEGIEIEGVRYGPIDANMERSSGHNKWIEMTLTEGKNREVRRVLEHLGLEVSRLIRVAYGPFLLEDLPRGMVEEVRPADVERFRKQLGLAPNRYEAPAALPVRPVRATPRKPETMVAKKAPAPARDAAPTGKPAGRSAGHGPGKPAGKPAGRPEGKSAPRRAGAEEKPRTPRAENPRREHAPRHASRRDEERLVDRPSGRSARPERVRTPAEGPAEPKRSTKGWAKAKPKVKPTGKPRRPSGPRS